MVLDVRRRRDAKRCRRARVWLNGAEVTRDCFKTDGRRGHVWLFLRNAEDQRYLTQNEREGYRRPRMGSPAGPVVAQTIAHGHVRIQVAR